MNLSKQVHVANRYKRAVRIDHDLYDDNALDGFICQESLKEVLLSIARHVKETKQTAFTWTGPYGCGKSTLAVAFGALLNGNLVSRDMARKAIGETTSDQILNSLPPGTNGWRILPVVGRRDTPTAIIGEAMIKARIISQSQIKDWDDNYVINLLSSEAAKYPKKHGGLIVFIDEMGKILENAAIQGNDIYIFQSLAEAASRSSNRLIVIGVLHQAFQEYVHRLSYEMRDEWSKINGRYIDLTLNTATEEQISLISKAIIKQETPEKYLNLANEIYNTISHYKPNLTTYYHKLLESCWPLHPVTACLLGPISRRRFGQNQRSIFGFLNSVEPEGFNDFIKNATDEQIYEPYRLWDYLRLNLEPSILASPDGHRWAIAVEAIERCEAFGFDSIHIKIIKTIAVIDLFKERTGLSPSIKILELCLCYNYSIRILKNALHELLSSSLIIYKKYMEAYSVYAGSDFDIDQAVNETINYAEEIDFTELKELAGLQPVLAKRHYHKTGALRWLDTDIVPLHKLTDCTEKNTLDNDIFGKLILTVPTDNESLKKATEICQGFSKSKNINGLVIGLSKKSLMITSFARELIVLNKLKKERIELGGDSVARLEIKARILEIKSNLENEMQQAFVNAKWYYKGKNIGQLSWKEINALASVLADKRFPHTPLIKNELLNRIKPSSNAIAARNTLIRLMVTKRGLPRLGIVGFPAEGGLFTSLLESTGLYREIEGKFDFVSPENNKNDSHKLYAIWSKATLYLKKNHDRNVNLSEIMNLWRRPPFGVHDGILSILSVAFIMSNSRYLAFYRQKAFRPQITDVDMDYLAKDPNDIQIRWVNISGFSEQLLSGIADVVDKFTPSDSLDRLSPIDVARNLVMIYENLPPWCKRTMQISNNASKLRNSLKLAADPNKLLFDDIPSILLSDRDKYDFDSINDIVGNLLSGLEELTCVYSIKIAEIRDIMLAELNVTKKTSKELKMLQQRAKNIKSLTGDFRLEAFINRIASFEDNLKDIEGIISLVSEKPPLNWIDPDLDQASLNIADFAQQFIRAESFARVKGRSDKSQSISVVVGVNGRPTPFHKEFIITDTETLVMKEIVNNIHSLLQREKKVKKNIIIAALAELTAKYIDQDKVDK